jgi:hypothetical protein
MLAGRDPRDALRCALRQGNLGLAH